MILSAPPAPALIFDRVSLDFAGKPLFHDLTLRLPGGHIDLTLCAAWAMDDITRAQAQGARPLAEGEWLSLDDASAASHRLVVCSAQRQPGVRWRTDVGGRSPYVGSSDRTTHRRST